MKKIILILPVIMGLTVACAHKQQISVTQENYVSAEDVARYRENIVEKRRGPD